MLQEIPFSSSGNVVAVLYDEDSQTLLVRYRLGEYEYAPVTGEQAAELSSAPSATAYIRDVIKAMAEENRVG